MRMYQAQLLDDFAARAGQVTVGKWQAGDVERLSDEHDLMVVASGRGSLTDMFARIPERSPYTEPQRRLCAGLYHGVAIPQPARFRFTVSPGHGDQLTVGAG